MAVQSLADGTSWGDCEVVIVDNRSTEEEVAVLATLEQSHPGVHVIYNPSNVGYFPGLNLGIEYLQNEHPEIGHLVIGNNDLVFPPDFVEAIEENKELFSQYPVIAPDIVTLDGVHQNPHVVGDFSRIRLFLWQLYYSNYHLAMFMRKAARLTRAFTERKDYSQHAEAGPIAQGFGACYVLGPIFQGDFKTLWAPTFLMHEEYFFSEQLGAKGHVVYYSPKIVVRHHCHASVGNLPSRRLWELSRDAYRVILRKPSPPR